MLKWRESDVNKGFFFNTLFLINFSYLLGFKLIWTKCQDKTLKLPLSPRREGLKKKSYGRQQLHSTRKVCKHQQIPPLSITTQTAKREKCFSVPQDICTPEELLSFAVEIPTLLANLPSHIGVDLKETTLSETITGQLSNILAKYEHELQEAGCHFLSHEKIFGTAISKTLLWCKKELAKEQLIAQHGLHWLDERATIC